MNRSVTHAQWPKRLAWVLFIAIVLMGVGAVILFLLNRNTPVPPSWGAAGGVRDKPGDVVNIVLQALVLSVSSGLFGALIIGRLPRHTIGWLLVTIGLFSTVTPLLGEWTIYGYYTRGEPTAGHGLAAWITNWAWIALFGSLLWTLAIFPDGRPLSRRWRLLTTTATLVFVLFTLVGAMIETPMSSAYQAPNPFVSEHREAVYNTLFAVGTAFMPITIIVVLAAVLARFRQARGRERQQMKWLMGGVALMAVMALVGLLLSLGLGISAGDFLVNSSFLGALLGIGVAMLRHRLYDIDLIIRRTLIYSVLTAVLALVYFGSVVILQSVVTAVSGQPSSLTIVLSTLAIAVLFSPLRRRVQQLIDRRFFRNKYDAEQMLNQFAKTARGETELVKLGEELLTVVGETMQPQQAWLWLRGDSGGESVVMSEGAASVSAHPYQSKAS